MPRRKSFTKKNVVPILSLVVDAVKRLAASQPEYVYRKNPFESTAACLYRPNKLNPQGCLIGAAFRECGVNFNKNHEGKSIDVLLGYLDVPVSKETEFLKDAQWAQDTGSDWACAVRRGQEGFDEYVAFDDEEGGTTERD